MNGTPPSSTQRESRLIGAFVELADTLVDDYDVPEVLHRLAQRCVDLLGVSTAGLLLSDQRGSLQLIASSSERTRLLELFQLQANEGPCLDCFHSGEVVDVADLSTAVQRWPSFAPQAIENGFASVHAVPLRLRRDTIGTLNLFKHETGTLTEQNAVVARALADIATIGIMQDRVVRHGEILTEQLQTALNSRVTIEQAKGILSQAANLDMEQAFQALRGYARGHNTRLSEVAHGLATGQLTPDQVLTHQRTGTS